MRIMRSNRFHRNRLDTELLERRDLLAVTPVAADWVTELPAYTSVDTLWPIDTATDSSGNLFLLGGFRGTVDFDPGPGVTKLTALSRDLAVSKYDSSGALVDAIDIGTIFPYGGQFGEGASLATDDAGRIYVAGNYSGEATLMNGQVLPNPGDGPATAAFIVRLDNDLQNIDWASHVLLAGYGPWSHGEVRLGEIAVDSGGTSLYGAGRMVGEGTIGGVKMKVNFETFVWRMDASTGAFEWVKILPNLGNNALATVSVDPTGDDSVFVHLPQDSQTVKIDVAGNIVWEKSFPVAWNDFVAYGGAVYATGSFSDQLTLGSTTLTSAGGTDAFAARLDADTGDVTWATRAGGPVQDTANRIAVDSIGGVFVAGTFADVALFGAEALAARTSADVFFSQLSPADGSYVQSWRYGPAYETIDLSTMAGHVYVAGKYGAGRVDFPTGFVSLPTAGDRYGRYLMGFTPAADPTVPRLNWFAANPDPVDQGDPLSLSIEGLYDPDARVDSVAFYRDVDSDYRLNPAIDVLLGIDSDGTDGWGINAATAGLPLGTVRLLAQARYDGIQLSLAALGQVFVRNAPTTYSNVTQRTIPDRRTISSTLDVADSFTLSDVDVTLDIGHPTDMDLDIFLIHPDGTRVELITDVGEYNENFIDTTLDDQAISAIAELPSSWAPYTGRFRPESALSVLNGKDSAGLWRLEITDDERRDSGVLNSWSITLTPQTPPQPSFSVNDIQIIEGDTGAVSAQFTITRSGDLSGSVSVDYSTADSSANAGSDYVEVSTTTLTFASGVATQQVNVTINGDTDTEVDETFFINLVNPVGATVFDGQGVATIIDNDSPIPADVLYVYDIRFESKRGGKDYRAIFEVRSDSNHNGQGDAMDTPPAGVELTVTFLGNTYTGVTDSSGVLRTAWVKSVPSGSHYANAIDLRAQ